METLDRIDLSQRTSKLRSARFISRRSGRGWIEAELGRARLDVTQSRFLVSTVQTVPRYHSGRTLVSQRLRLRRPTANQGAPDGSGQDAPDDRQLVLSALANPVLFERLFSKYWDPILRYCAWRLADPADAEDAAIRVMTKAFTALPQVASGTGEFRAWLFTIARNEVINTYRLQTRHDNDRIQDEIELIDPAPTPEQHALASDERLRLRLLLMELPQRSREVVELRLVGFTDREIATVLGISDGAVRQAQSRAMGSLRELIRADHDLVEGSHV